MNFPADIWPKVLSLMEGDMTATTINTWFDDATPVALDANRFVLHTPSNFKRDIIMARYLPVIQKALHELFSADFEVVVLGEGELGTSARKKPTMSFCRAPRSTPLSGSWWARPTNSPTRRPRR